MAKEKQMRHKSKVRKKGIKMKFYEVDAPMTNTKISLYGSGPEDIDGSVVKLDLSRSLRGKGFEFRLRIKADGNNLNAEPISLKLVMSYIRRVMRKGSDYVEDSFEMDCRDKKIRVKPFMITRKKVSRAVRNTIRETARKFLQSQLKTITAEEIFTDIMTNKIQKKLSVKLKKVYPLAFCELRCFEVIGEKSVDEEEKKKKEEIAEKEEKKKKEEIAEKEEKKDSE